MSAFQTLLIGFHTAASALGYDISRIDWRKRYASGPTMTTTWRGGNRYENPCQSYDGTISHKDVEEDLARILNHKF
jgi:hypothetical protein